MTAEHVEMQQKTGHWNAEEADQTESCFSLCDGFLKGLHIAAFEKSVGQCKWCGIMVPLQVVFFDPGETHVFSAIYRGP